LILRKKEDDTEIRIEGFWEECQPGETQCTAVFNVVGENGQVTEAVLTQDGPVLENFTAGQSGTLSDDDRGGFIWLGGLAFGGGLAAMALAAGGGGGSKHRHENHEADTTTPSVPTLKAENDGSVSATLPGDANQGDNVDVAFTDVPVLKIPEAVDGVNAKELKDGVQAEVTLPT
ncbi:hypothetical protein H5Q51_26840, partial [Escherichia coli]|nr:hypothetical protein [Escherichia coli]